MDSADALAGYRDRFVESDGLVAYLDGNSLGRPLKASVERLATFTREDWGGRLIRGWDEGWMQLPLDIGDELGRVALGAAAGQVAIADSTTVVLYKLVRAALDARPGRTEIVIDRENFPTDRYIVEGIARDRGLTVRWIETPHDGGVTPELVANAVGPHTAVALFSSVAYRSAWLADIPAVTAVVHGAGGLVIWDLSHSVGVVPTPLDEWGVDLAVGCGYKYLNGGPGAPAFLYVRRELQAELRQPIQGWLGSATPFEMGQGYEAAAGIRGFLSGTPPVIGMQPMRDMIALLGEVGLDAVRAKSVALTEHAIALVDDLLPDAALASPRDASRRGGHITIDHPRFADIMPALWSAGVIPDFRRPDGIRLGLSPLSTSFAEVEAGVRAIAGAL
ncbi:kynureninase [Leifsonia sp. AK011]|uniref:kynureninase n=1 Tax=Leifsonia sp. AK011 TaxID=2723075 RepID=UPI0015CAD6C4|nr:aminotransferase class V-fold PLP-dependent enzyme [Leifsonia sp. AK011]NYF09169.1 kynureninase [Leifsonia sp. AK011]